MCVFHQEPWIIRWEINEKKFHNAGESKKQNPSHPPDPEPN